MNEKALQAPISSVPLTGLLSSRSPAAHYLHDDRLFPRFYRYRPDGVPEQVKTLRESQGVERGALCDALSALNLSLEGGPEVSRSIEALRRGALCVVAGQQPGLLTGPLYTIYKALQTIRLARTLSEDEGAEFVPLFWVGSEDHDQPEMDHAHFIDRDGSPLRVRYPISSRYAGWAAGKIPLGPEREELLKQLRGLLLPETLDFVESHLIGSATFGEFFCRLMEALFSEEGLILLDPSHPTIKKLSLPLFRKALGEDPLRVAHGVNSAGEALSALGLRPQVHKPLRSSACFMEEESVRQRLEFEKGIFRTQRRSYSREEILDLLERNPERFSANAVFRPLLSQYLLPAAAHVVGPGELGYFAQLGVLFDDFGLAMPVLFPRVSLTLLEEKVAKVVDGYGFNPLELKDPDVLLKRLARADRELPPPESWERARERVGSGFGGLREELGRLDPTLAGALEGNMRRALFLLEELEGKALRAVRRKDEVAHRRILNARAFIFPEGVLQERMMNIFHYLDRYSLSFLKGLLRAIPEDFERHHFLRLPLS